MATVIYKNTSKSDMIIPGVGELKAGEQVSLSGEHLPVVLLENHPGLIDLEKEEQKKKDKKNDKDN